MEFLFILGCVIAVIVLFSGHAALRSEIRELRAHVFKLRQDLAAATAAATPAAPVTLEPAPQAPASPLRPPMPKEEEAHVSFERQFGGRAFVWIGGVALALAGFFLVKYSIEMGLITETVRIFLGLAFGAALIVTSLGVRALKNLADGTRIAQALAGAGIADLYGSLFAATTLYHLVPPWIGFGAMAGVTALALLMSLRFGSPIAVLGLIGGYATPVLVHGDPNTPLLFGYLYIVCAGLTAVARGRQWWWLSLPSQVVAYGWVVGWLVLGWATHEAFWLSIFLVAIGVTSAAADKLTADDETDWPRLAVRNFAPAASLVLMGTVTWSAHFGTFEWAMFAILSVWAMLLARIDGRTYWTASWLALTANIVMLAAWTDAGNLRMAITIGGFAALFAAGSQILIWRSKQPVSWALVSAGAALAYFLLAYGKLNAALVADVGKLEADYIWSAIAVAAAAVFAIAVTLIFLLSKEKHVRQILQAIYTATATALVSIALAILLDQQYLPLAAAAEVLVLSLMARGLDIPTLRPIAMVLTAIFLLLNLAPVADLFAETVIGPVDHTILNALIRFLLPAGLLGLSAHNWRRATDDDGFVRTLEFLAVSLAAAFIQRTLTLVLAGHETRFHLLAASAKTAVLLLWCAIVAWIAKGRARVGMSAGAGLIAVLAGLHLVVWHLLAANPLIAHQWVGEFPVANGLLAAYAAPAFLYWLVARALPWRPAAIAANIAAYGLIVICVLLLVRQLFHGAYIDSGGATNAELYGYSVAGLVAGILLLLVGVVRKDPPMRVASLVVMMLTVGKVFLFDASNLTGLWRVVSFLGLGFSLLALSWFYSRFVFRERKD